MWGRGITMRYQFRGLAGVCLLVMGALPAVWSSRAGASGHDPTVTSDYGSYPLAFVPAGCTAQGGDILIGERFTSTTDTRSGG